MLSKSLFTEIKNDNDRAVFLTQDVTEGYDHRGCTPVLLKKLINNFKKLHPDKYVAYNTSKLMKNDVGPYYIFNKKYCKKIGELLGANIFVISRLVLVGHDEFGECKGDLFDIHVKVYSILNDKEITIFKENKVPVYKFDDLSINKENDSLWNKLQRDMCL